jgi:tRNA threonylcarbamoyladenosine biosynthesis protein TsaE
LILSTEGETRAAGSALAAQLRPGDLVTLEGPLGVGKTTLVRGLLEALGHRGEVPSPSFAIVQPYEELSPPVWHVDLYRIDDPTELEELGLESAREEGVLLIEWPSHGGEGAFADALALSLEARPDGARRLTARVPASWESRWPLP